MATFDLDRFRKIAFGRTARPNHPMAEIASAQKLLPDDDPDTDIADLAHCAATLNLAEDFTPVRRSRIFMLLDAAARPVWRHLDQQYLAPSGKLSEGGERILRALRQRHEIRRRLRNLSRRRNHRCPSANSCWAPAWPAGDGCSAFPCRRATGNCA